MKYFFEIPIFRLSETEYNKSLQVKINRQIELYKKNTPGIMYDYTSIVLKNFEDDFSNYRYGELVGIIKLFILGNQIRGELYFVKQKITSSLKNKTWQLQEMKIFEFTIHQSFTSKKIYNLIIYNLDKYQKENKKLRGFHIDLSVFKNVGEHINYNKI